MPENKWGVIPEQAKILEKLEDIIKAPLTEIDKIYYECLEIGIVVAEERVSGLSLHNCALDEIPTSLSDFDTLKSLCLSLNNFKTIPQCISDLRSLEWLDMHCNYIEALPTWFQDLKFLKILDLMDNQFDHFPKPLLGLKKLEYINLSRDWGGSNKIKDIPISIDSLESLEDLRLNHNEISSLPESFGNLKVLDTLQLIGNNLDSLPETFGNLRALENLDLSRNNLTVLPENFGDLEKLTRLVLNNNHLSDLPESFAHLQSLQQLELSNNEFSSIPTSIRKLKKLETLGLVKNHIASIPDFLAELKFLETLNLNNNELKTIPAALWCLKNLKHLYLRDNPWEDEWVEIINANSDLSGKFVNIPSFLEILRKSCSVTLFLSYAVTDYESYPLAKVADNLKSREEIYYVYHCMQDMEKAGNIDDFMREFIALSHILLFFATERSLRSEDCRHELESAKSLGLKIIPILGAGVTWRDLERLGIEREYGLNIRDYKLYQDLFERFILLYLHS